MITSSASSVRSGRQWAAALLLVLPVVISIADAGGWLSSSVATLFGGAANATVLFNVYMLREAFAAVATAVAFILLLPRSIDRVVRLALLLAVVANIYISAFYLLPVLFPSLLGGFPAAVGSTLLLLAVIVSCYACTLFVGHSALTMRERLWSLPLLLPYIMSFVTFYSPEFVQNIWSAGDVQNLLLAIAVVWSVVYGVALWRLAFSSLFAGRGSATGDAASSFSPLNIYMLAVALLSFVAVRLAG